jgi:BASS family bile acid:Na+ symporter
MKSLLRNRDFILPLALILGVFLGHGAVWTRPLVLPVLALVMTLSTMAVSGQIFRSPGSLLIPALVGILMSYLVLTGMLLGISRLVIEDKALWTGFVILAAVPPAVAVIPFSEFLEGSHSYALIGTMGAYLGGLILMPLIALFFIGTGFIDPSRILVVMIELIVIPLVLSRILLWTRVDRWIGGMKGTLTNWSFFVVTYTIVGLNRDFIFNDPLSLLPVAFIAVASTFLLGYVVELVGRVLKIDPEITVTLVLLATLKNYGLAGGIALMIFDKQTAVPATVSTIFMIVYIAWLSFKIRQRGKKHSDCSQVQG